MIFVLLPGIVIGMTALFPLGSYLTKRVDPRLYIALLIYFRLLILVLPIGVGSTFISSFMQSYWGFWVFFSLGFGICNGLAVKEFSIIF